MGSVSTFLLIFSVSISTDILKITIRNFFEQMTTLPCPLYSLCPAGIGHICMYTWQTVDMEGKWPASEARMCMVEAGCWVQLDESSISKVCQHLPLGSGMCSLESLLQLHQHQPSCHLPKCNQQQKQFDINTANMTLPIGCRVMMA